MYAGPKCLLPFFFPPKDLQKYLWTTESISRIDNCSYLSVRILNSLGFAVKSSSKVHFCSSLWRTEKLWTNINSSVKAINFAGLSCLALQKHIKWPSVCYLATNTEIYHHFVKSRLNFKTSQILLYFSTIFSLYRSIHFSFMLLRQLKWRSCS